MGQVKGKIKWTQKIIVRGRETEADSDARLIIYGTDETRKLFEEKIKELQVTATLFRRNLDNLRINADAYKKTPLEQRKDFKRKLNNNCREALNELSKIKSITRKM